MDKLLDPHTKKICDALLFDIVRTTDNGEESTVKFFRKDLISIDYLAIYTQIL